MKPLEETIDGPVPAGRVRRLFRGLKSVRFAIILMALIAVACVAGTLIAQGSYDADEAGAHYGRVLGFLVGLLGLNHLYSAWWFVGLLVLLAASVATCAFSGLRFTFRKLCTLIVHVSILLIVAGATLRAVAGVNGELALEKGQALSAFLAESGSPPGFVSVPLGFKLRLDDFVIQYYSEGAVESYESRVTILDERGKEIRRASIFVNQPLRVGRYTLYQASYTPTMGTVLQVSSDPGVPLVFAGFILLPIGIALAFYGRLLLGRKGRGDV